MRQCGGRDPSTEQQVFLATSAILIHTHILLHSSLCRSVSVEQILRPESHNLLISVSWDLKNVGHLIIFLEKKIPVSNEYQSINSFKFYD